MWDTSNQCYTHKLVTGRAGGFATIRKPGGLPGLRRADGERARHVRRRPRGDRPVVRAGARRHHQGDPAEPYVVVVVGDGAMTLGTSYEALDNIVHIKPKRLVVVLNDNGWSISENVGWIAHWRNRFELHPAYKRLTEKRARPLKSCRRGRRPGASQEDTRTPSRGYSSRTSCRTAGRPLRRADQRPRLQGARGSPRAREEFRGRTPVVIHALTHRAGATTRPRRPVALPRPGTPSPPRPRARLPRTGGCSRGRSSR